MKRLLIMAVLLSLLCAGRAWAAPPPTPWPGVDESVVERVAAEHGRTPARPLIEGDPLLFMFLCGGLASGCVLGYCYRMLFTESFDKPSSDAR